MIEKYPIEILEDIMKDAMLGLSLMEISIRLNMPYQEFYEDYCILNTQVKAYYDAGRSKGKIETDKSLFELAKSGSTAAKDAYDDKLIQAHLQNSFLEILNS